jgi:putative NIF3 family GTP cyclohydrolase 1 type 2
LKNSEPNNTISRRGFLSGLPSVTTALASAVPAGAQAQTPGSLTAGDVHAYLKSLDGGWVNWEKTVDTFKAGSPEAVVKGIAVAWMSYTYALKKALDLGCNLFVTHEPTYFNHHDNDTDIFRFPAVKAKREFIEKNGLVIIRCHDVWDGYPKIGIPTGWGTLLELGEPIEGGGYYYVYDGKGRTSGALARQIAARTAGMGQPGVQLIGPEDKPVKRIVLGTGAGTPMFHFIEKLGADMAICVDDGFTYWRDGAYAIDTGFPVAVVNHPVSEEYSMKLLAGFLSKKFPQLPVHHIPERCMYKLVGRKETRET